jgi:OPA family sugar phosphate sensor protein UhpC-like MFS transporter
MGFIGIASYVGAGIQDIISGYLMEHNKTIINGIANYNFTSLISFWIGSSLLSLLLALLVWKAKSAASK